MVTKFGKSNRVKAITLFLIFLLVSAGSITPTYAEDVIIGAKGGNHVDLFHLEPVNGKPKLFLSEDITGRKVLRDPNTTVLEVTDKAYYTQIPAHFPGAPSAYVLSQSGNNPDILWPGWDTLAVAKIGYQSTKFTFESVQGPGKVYMYQSTVNNPVSPVLSGGGIEVVNGSQIVEPFPTHKHVTWTFTKAGRYTFKVNVVSTKDGKDYNVGSATYRIDVDSKNQSKPPVEAPKADCRKGYEKKLANDGNYYCVSPNVANKIQENSNKPVGKTCKPVLERRQAKPGDKIKTTSTVLFNVGSSAGITSGHFDLGSAVINGEYTGVLKDDNQGLWVNPSSRTFALSDAARVSLPAGLSSIGEKGATAWMIDQTQKPSVPWVGINTQHPGLLQNTTGNVTFQMNYVGPGRVALVEGSSFGQSGRVLLGAGGGSSWTVPANSHTHPNWFFSAPGQYSVIITQTTVARTNVAWNELVGRDENGNECSASLPQSYGKVASKTDKDKKEEKEVSKKAKAVKFNASGKEYTSEQSSNSIYYALAGVGILALLISSGIIIYSFRTKSEN